MVWCQSIDYCMTDGSVSCNVIRLKLSVSQPFMFQLGLRALQIWWMWLVRILEWWWASNQPILFMYFVCYETCGGTYIVAWLGFCIPLTALWITHHYWNRNLCWGIIVLLFLLKSQWNGLLAVLVRHHQLPNVNQQLPLAIGVHNSLPPCRTLRRLSNQMKWQSPSRMHILKQYITTWCYQRKILQIFDH